MKLISLFSLFLFISCNLKSDKKNSPTPGIDSQTRRLDPMPVLAEELTRIDQICRALDSKMGTLADVGDTRFTFDYSQKTCDATDFGQNQEIITRIEPGVQGNYIFRQLDGSPFPFSNVELRTFGSLEKICENLVDLRSPMQTSPSNAIWFTTFTNTRDCSADGINTLCIRIEKGTVGADGRYKITSSEWAKYRISGQRIGFFVEKKLTSTSFCPAGKFEMRRAALR